MSVSGCEEQIEHHPAGVLRSAEELPVRKNRFVIRRMPDFMTGCGYMPSEPHGEGDIAVELWKKLEPGEK